MDTPHSPALLQAERLWSPRQIAAAAFIGSPLAAGWFFFRNYTALGDESGARRAVWLSLVATAAILALGFVLPRGIPKEIVPAAYAFAIERYASRCFGAAYTRHTAMGGAKGSWWTVVGIGIVTLLLLIAVAVVLLYVIAWWTGSRIDWRH